MRVSIKVITAVLSLGVSTSVFGGQCDSQTELSKFRAWVDGIKDYEVSLDIKRDVTRGAKYSKLTGISGERMRVDVTSNSGDYSEVKTAIFDGKRQWSVTKTSLGTEVLSLDVSKLAAEERPFDTSFYLIGVGLISGEDFPSSLRTVIDIYDFSDYCVVDDVIHLKGVINKDDYISYVKKSRFSEKKMHFVDKYVENLKLVDITLDKNTHQVISYGFGNKDASVVRYTVTSAEVNKDRKHDEFDYSLPEDLVAADITNVLLSRAGLK